MTKNKIILNDRDCDTNSGECLFPELQDDLSLESVGVFRPIHYLGSKLRIVDVIKNNIDSVDPTHGYMCDLFAGSGTVSKYLSHTRPVISVDIQEYSRVICSALLQPNCIDISSSDFVDLCKRSKHLQDITWALLPLVDYESTCIESSIAGDPLPLCELLEKGSIISFEKGFIYECSKELNSKLKEVCFRLSKLNMLSGPKALITRFYGGIYFSYEQSLELDVILEILFNYDERSKNALLAAALSTASDIVNTVGKQFAQPLRPRSSEGFPKKYIGERVQRDRGQKVFMIYEKWLDCYLRQPSPDCRNIVIKGDYLEALDQIQQDVKVIYADPPYTRDHYSRFYHVLETMSLRDNPSLSTTTLDGTTFLSRGLYRLERHQSPFCIKTKAASAFERLFKKARYMECPIVLSYSPYSLKKKAHPRLLTISCLETIAKKYYKKVNMVPIKSITHSKLNSTDKNIDKDCDSEILCICEIK